jgi:hypothetical protein
MRLLLRSLLPYPLPNPASTWLILGQGPLLGALVLSRLVLQVLIFSRLFLKVFVLSRLFLKVFVLSRLVL